MSESDAIRNAEKQRILDAIDKLRMDMSDYCKTYAIPAFVSSTMECHLGQSRNMFKRADVYGSTVHNTTSV